MASSGRNQDFGRRDSRLDARCFSPFNTLPFPRLQPIFDLVLPSVRGASPRSSAIRAVVASDACFCGTVASGGGVPTIGARGCYFLGHFSPSKKAPVETLGLSGGLNSIFDSLQGAMPTEIFDLEIEIGRSITPSRTPVHAGVSPDPAGESPFRIHDNFVGGYVPPIPGILPGERTVLREALGQCFAIPPVASDKLHIQCPV